MPARHSLTGQIYLKFVLLRIRQALAVGLIALAPALTGCLTHIRAVPKTRPAEVVMGATLDQLLKQVDQRLTAIQTINASVEVVATEGGGREGQVKEFPSFGGYIFLRKPDDLRVLLRVPYLGSVGLDMVSDGRSWKLWIPKQNRAMTGTSEVADPSQHGLESLRPAVIFDSLLIHGLASDQIVSLTQDSRIVTNPKKKTDLIEEPDYDIEILNQPAGLTAHTIRVIHISRTNLLPYQQDIYGPDGTVVTRALYSNYQMSPDPKAGDIAFPMKIEIQRPQDQYTLTITITKLTLNQRLEDDQFELKLPEGIPVKTTN
jgi:outer membrane lipoprotein-sorting protein